MFTTKTFKQNIGFTIIELVIVISVLAILMGISIPRIKGMIQQANIVKAKKELASLETGVEQYYTFASPKPILLQQIQLQLLILLIPYNN